MKPLSTCRHHERLVVETIDGDRGLMAQLGGMGIHPGDEVMVVRASHFHGPVLLEVHGTRVAVGRGMAERITVRTKEN